MSSTRNEIKNSSEQESTRQPKQKIELHDLPSAYRSANLYTPQPLPVHKESPTNRPQPADEYVDFPHRKYGW